MTCLLRAVSGRKGPTAPIAELTPDGRFDHQLSRVALVTGRVSGPAPLGRSDPMLSRMTEAGSELQRFIDAQDRGGAYEQALSELRAGGKRGHWIWFVFPQINGLGSSDMSRRYGIRSLAEASAYLAHPVLGPRLVACAQALLALGGSDPTAVMGGLDAVKLRSSMTLFAHTAEVHPAFALVLDKYFGGEVDPATEERLGGQPD